MSSSQGSQERQPRRQKKQQQQVVEESESDSGSEEQYEPPKRSNRRSRQQNNQMQQRQQQGPMNQMGGGMPGTMGNVANQAMQQQQQPQGGGGGGKSDTLRLRLDLNLDIEITLKAKIHGDLELALLYVLTLFIFYRSHPLLISCHPAVWCHARGRGCKLTSKWMEKPPCLLISLSPFFGHTATGKIAKNTCHTVQPTPVSSPSHCNHICSVSKGRAGTQHKNRGCAPWTAAKRREHSET